MVDVKAQFHKLPKWSWYAGGIGLVLGGAILLRNRSKAAIPVSDTAQVDPGQLEGTGLPNYPYNTGGGSTAGNGDDPYQSGMPGPSGAPGELGPQGPTGDPGQAGADAADAPTAAEVAAELSGSLGTIRKASKPASAAKVKEAKSKAMSAADKKELLKENKTRAAHGLAPRKEPSYTHSGTGPPKADSHHSPVHTPVHPAPPKKTIAQAVPKKLPSLGKAAAPKAKPVPTVVKPPSGGHSQPKAAAVHAPAPKPTPIHHSPPPPPPKKKKK